jgi:D-alanyl-D-alanine dipeptidase
VHPQEEREALFGAWLEGIDALAAGRTQVWLVEDVHWAGGDVLAFLDRAVARGAAGPPGGRLIVATTRPSLLEANPDWSAELAENGRQLLQLSTLAPTDARSLVWATRCPIPSSNASPSAAMATHSSSRSCCAPGSASARLCAKTSAGG